MGIKAENYVDSCLSNLNNLRDLIIRATLACYPTAKVKTHGYSVQCGCLYFSTCDTQTKIELIGEVDTYLYSPNQPWAQSIVPALRRALTDMHQFAEIREHRRALARKADLENLVLAVNAMEFTYAQDAEAKP